MWVGVVFLGQPSIDSVSVAGYRVLLFDYCLDFPLDPWLPLGVRLRFLIWVSIFVWHGLLLWRSPAPKSVSFAGCIVCGVVMCWKDLFTYVCLRVSGCESYMYMFVCMGVLH